MGLRMVGLTFLGTLIRRGLGIVMDMKVRLGLHNHTQMSDGYFTIGGLLRHLSEEYEVVAITDHNYWTEVHPIHIRENDVEELLILQGIEVTFPRIHIVCLEPIRHETIKDCLDTARVAWIAHPNFSMLKPEDCKLICDKYHLQGVEQYNSGYIDFKPPVNWEEWELNLYAGDDLHIPSQIKKSWMEMEVGTLDVDEVMEKLIAGEFELKNAPDETEDIMEWMR